MNADCRNQIRALQALVDAVKVAGDSGAPGGVMYAALLDKLSLDKFNSIMGLLVRLGAVRKKGDLYFWQKDLPQCGS